MKSKFLMTLSACFILFGMLGCSNEEPFSTESGKKELSLTDETTPPVVRTDPEIVSVTSMSFTVKGYLDSEGSSRVRYRGFVYSDTTDMPTLNDRTTYILSGDFQKKITSLTTGSEYYVRAFAINSTDTAYGAPVKVVPEFSGMQTLAVVNRVRVAALVCGQFFDVDEISNMKEYGVCLSSDPNPTVTDRREKAPDYDKTDIVGSFGVFFDNLTRETMYHVRAYGIMKNGNVVYGNDRIFQTTKGGQMTSTFWNGEDCLREDPAAYVRIKQAIDSALYYYNNYSNLVKHINYNYSPGVPTADCNIEGWMRFGTNERYQWVGTAQHEISHAIGVGTAWNWDGFFTNGNWSKPRAKQALRVMMKDMTQQIHLSGQHFWPGGINQREEVTNGTTNSYGVNINNALMLKLNAMVLNGMREDGL